MLTKILGYFVRHLDLADSMSEIIFGLIMVLSITLTAGYYVEGSADPARSLVIAAVGCNVAWGLIDGVMYVVTSLYERATHNRLIMRVRDKSDQNAAIADIRNIVSSAVGELLSPAELEKATASVYAKARDAQPKEVQINRDDLMGGAACFLLNFTATLPASMPFLFIEDWMLALRVSNVVTITMMFAVGFYWARYVNVSRFKFGISMASLGLAMVMIAVTLGG